MRLQLSHIAAALLLVVLVTGCATVTVKFDYDPEVNYTRYKTFDILTQKDRPAKAKHRAPVNPLMRKRVERAIEREMIAIGYDKTGRGRADLLIAFHTNVQHKVDVDHWGYGYGRRWRHTEVHHYKEGTLVIDFVDRETRELVWRGWATGVIGGRDQAEEQINESVAKIIAQFPSGG